MPRFKKHAEQEDGWSEWINPVKRKYKMACCDCGLVHNMDFRIVEDKTPKDKKGVTRGKEYKKKDLAIVFRAQRNNRSTAQMRRNKKK